MNLICSYKTLYDLIDQIILLLADNHQLGLNQLI